MARVSRARFALVSVAAASAALVVAAPMASSANPHVSNLVSATSEVDLQIPLLTDPVTANPTQNVTVNLDPLTCPNALDGGLTYSVTATTDDTAVATVAGPIADAALQCTGTHTNATFTVSPVACGSTNVNFFPVVANPSGKLPPGAQGKVGSLSIPVVITDANDAECGGSGQGDGGGDRPAAPSVANSYIYAAGTTLTDQCKQHGFVQKGKFSRGGLISQIAAWMPRPESVKDDTNLYPDADNWIDYVRSAVDAYCTGQAPPPIPVGTWNNL
jgi:hypothetical protein